MRAVGICRLYESRRILSRRFHPCGRRTQKLWNAGQKKLLQQRIRTPGGNCLISPALHRAYRCIGTLRQALRLCGLFEKKRGISLSLSV